MCRKPCRVANPRGVGVAVSSRSGNRSKSACSAMAASIRAKLAPRQAWTPLLKERWSLALARVMSNRSGLRENIGVTICTAQQKRDGLVCAKCWPAN